MSRRPGSARSGSTAGAWLRRLAAGALLVYGALFAWTGHLAGRAEDAFRDGRYDEAHAILTRAAFWKVRSGRVRDGLGVTDLARGRLDEGRAHLADARRGLFHPDAFGERKVVAHLLREGKIAPAQIYASHRVELSRSRSLRYHLGLAEEALFDLDRAETMYDAAMAQPGLREAAQARRLIVAEKRRAGRADYLFDREGRPIAGVALATRRPAPLAPDLAPWLGPPQGPELDARDLSGRVRLTLDLDVQRAAQSALGRQPGAIVAIDLERGGLLAAASWPPAADGASPPFALAGTFEPGSIIKMLTLTAALRQGIRPESLFPMDCPGWIEIDGAAFRDWMPHRSVPSIEEAVAVSCNIAFARLGAAVGRDALDAELRRFGFDMPPPPSDLSYRVGSSRPRDAQRPGHALARRAVGLDSLEITPIGAALLAGGLARAGQPLVASLIEERRNILGEARSGTSTAPADAVADPLPPEGAALVTRCMRAAVDSPRGTARRAALEGVGTAMKTGTSGSNPPGLDAVVIGFAPADRPAVAWAVVALRSGKAELAGARITGDFLGRIKDEISAPRGVP